MKVKDILGEGTAEKSFPRRVEDYINNNFYVYDWTRADSDEHIDYTIEESKARYRIIAFTNGIYGIVDVLADTGSGATEKRALGIKRELSAL